MHHITGAQIELILVLTMLEPCRDTQIRNLYKSKSPVKQVEYFWSLFFLLLQAALLQMCGTNRPGNQL